MMFEKGNLLNTINENFSLNSYKCAFNISKIENLRGDIETSLIVTPIVEAPLYYAYSGANGLCRTREFGGIENENLLSKVISLSNKDAKETLEFLQNNGFLFPLESNVDTVINLSDMIELLNRIKATTLLLNSLETKPLNYNDILTHTLYLILGKPVNMTLSSKAVYSSVKFPFMNNIGGVGNIYNNNSNTLTIDDFEYYCIDDTIYPQKFNLLVDECEDICSGETFMYNYPGIQDTLYRQLTSAFVNSSLPNKQQHIIDFLFHIMHGIGVIKSVSFDNGIEFYDDKVTIQLDSYMESALINVAKLTLSQEINYNIRKMQPLYSPSKLEPTWKAPSLLVALYFSIFFMKPSSEVYRKCANPSCKNYFTVKTSNTRKRYCCDNCRGANNSRDHRKRMKNKT